MNDHRRQLALPQDEFQIRPKAFIFFDRQSHTQRFEVPAGTDGRLPEEQAVSLLAVQCLVRGQVPQDFDVMVSAGDDLISSLVLRTKKLIQTYLSTTTTVDLSKRQREVLRAIVQNLSNKEIASRRIFPCEP